MVNDLVGVTTMVTIWKNEGKNPGSQRSVNNYTNQALSPGNLDSNAVLLGGLVTP